MNRLEKRHASTSNVVMLTAQELQARQDLSDGGGFLYPFRRGYKKLATILDALPPDAWRQDETILGVLVLHLLKRGQASQAKSYFYSTNLEFEKTFRFGLLELMLALHLGEPISDAKLASWRRLEREIPFSDPLLQGLYYNSMMAMHVRLHRLDEARVAGQQAISCFREDGHAYLEHFIHVHLADLDVSEGRLRRAARGLRTAERCLELSGPHDSNEAQIIAIIRLAIDYERGHLSRVRQSSAQLRNSLMNGDSWSELFYQLARISVMSAYFLEGRKAAQSELEVFQADYARRHSGVPITIDILDARLSYLEWQQDTAERRLDELKGSTLHSAMGQGMRDELRVSLGACPALPRSTPRSAIVAALQEAQIQRGKQRRQAIEHAMRLALAEGQIAPFLEHRDVFIGANSMLSYRPFLRGNAPLARMVKRIMKQVSESYVVPEQLTTLGFNQRQYRVVAALQEGSTNKEVARQLGITEATVKYHLTKIYGMVGATKKSELIDIIINMGVFENT